MRTLSRRDIGSALATGFTTGIIGWQILVYLGTRLPLGLEPVFLVYIVPVCWLAGVQLGYFLGQYLRPFTQFGRFACIGFANAMVDFGVLYLGIAMTGLVGGFGYTVLKSISFIVATIHSYIWNKYWAFDAGRGAITSREVISFVGVAASSLVVNVAVASFVNLLRPAGFTPEAWAGVGAVAGSAAALVFSFTGFRLFVFKRK
jgi:putative flippase GtrA